MRNDNKLLGFRRSEAVFGIRNHVIILPTVHCASLVAWQIARSASGVVPILHQHGCDHIGHDREQVVRTLVGVANNPNVGGVLLIGLGCENVTVDEVFTMLQKSNRPVEKLVIQNIGDMDELIRLGKEYLARIKSVVESQIREEFDLSQLVVGVECGASDSFSGITANPAVGMVSDRLVGLDATVILSEIPELIGAEQLLLERIPNKEHQAKLLSNTQRYIDEAKSQAKDLVGTNPTPGNVQGGITTIEEKALGAAVKGGSSQINEVVEYAEAPSQRGLVIMDTPGNDPESLTGLVAGGAHVILFTTGLGTPLGYPVVPIIKISSNSETFGNMRSFTDLDAGGMLKGQSISEVSDAILQCLIDVARGEKTASENWDSGEIAINRIAPTF
ncbi:MAG: UxaA family hydrolase [Desulfobacteraceae bacterium]|nr:UxaA family hydrolase [Desulfobacteraceae bacterium]